MKEFQLIKKYFSNLSKDNPGSFELTDDVFFDKYKKLVISVDTYVEGVHFLNFNNPDLVIKKILRSSVSDIICKGVKPKLYFLSGSGNKKSFSKKNLELISNSLKSEQKKFNIKLGGGDTTYSSKLSFTFVSIGYSSKIIKRNNGKINDNIYVTGELGDSYIGLNILQKKINLDSSNKKYFIKKYYLPDIQYRLFDFINKHANTSIDLSDGLFSDTHKMINKKNLSFEINLDKIPLSSKLNRLIYLKKVKLENVVSKGDDYQILFSASKSKSRIINQLSKSSKIKITKIGKIISGRKEPLIIDKKGNKIALKNKGFEHQFWSFYCLLHFFLYCPGIIKLTTQLR